jgi:hypothetical protein
MPAITASLSKVGYEGYESIPKGQRSKVIDKILRDYALKRTHVIIEGRGQLSVMEVLDRQKNYEAIQANYLEQIMTLREELKELKGEEE